MEARLRNEKLPGTRTRFNARPFVSVALGILLCAGIAGCLAPPAPPSQFLLSSPAHLTTGVLLTPTLNWTDAVGETSYTVEIDDEDTFSSPLVHQNPGVAENTTSFVVPSGVLAGGTTYYWRVIAMNSGGSTIPRNAPWIFTAWSTGPLVPEFGTGGVVTSNPSTGGDSANGIAIDSTAMYVVGHDRSPGNPQWRIEKRSLTDGSLVPEFGAGGVVSSDPSTSWDVARAIAIDSTAMYVVGSDGSPEGWNSQWRIEKRSLTDGSLVPEFGAAGVVTSNPSAGFDVACGMAIDSTAMYVVGYDRSPGNPQWRIEKRSLTDGSLVPGFGAAGVITSNPSAGSDVARGIAIDSTAVYVVGCDNSPGEWDLQWRVEKRSLTDGSLVSEFGTGGVVTSNNTTGHHPPQDIAIDSTAMYVVGSDNSLWWRIEKRSLTDGSLVPEFGTGGVVISNPSGWYDEAYDIAIDSAAMYVVGIYSTMGYYSYHNEWRVEKRSLTDGGLVAEFGAGGVATSNTTGGADVAHGIAIDSAAMYVVGFDSGYPGERWRIEKRSLADGGLVPEFGAGGVVTSDPSGYDDRAYGIAIDSTALYVVGYDRSPGDAQWRIEKRFR